jgi:hypothetical protein
MTKTRAVMTAAITLIISAVLAGPAHARDYAWQDGETISSYPSGSKVDADAGVIWTKGDCPQLALTSIKMGGDYLWVRDDCKDGYSAIAIWRDGKTGKEFICRNKEGKGKVVRCKFNWPERDGSFIGGVADGLTVKYRDHGSSLLMDQDGNGCDVNPTRPTRPCRR